ncbi:MAG TPA: SDR family oxidoreductase [Candidatus Limnocylindrales bacterium]|jgi:NAD(P)-dependent dehydrogenase (short-subunit alcohol dehydrogenase family)
MSPEATVVLITGAAGPAGRAAARRFAADGARLVLVGRDRGRLDDVAAAAGLKDGAWLPVTADLVDATEARAVVGAAEARFGRVDVLLHLVGGWSGGTAVVDLDASDVRSMLDQHLWTTFHIAQAVVPGMTARGSGRILGVTTPFAANPGPRGAAYAVAKAAEEALLRSLAREVGGAGVTANLVVVRAIDAKHERETAPSPKNAAWVTPEELADTLAFLASPEAAAINGARVTLDGRA